MNKWPKKIFSRTSERKFFINDLMGYFLRVLVGFFSYVIFGKEIFVNSLDRKGYTPKNFNQVIS